MSNRNSAPRRAPVFLSLLASAALIAACEERNEFAPPPPAKVTVSKPLKQSVTDYLIFTGTLRATEEVEIRARVQGWLESAHFEPGKVVQQGDLLYKIDPRNYQAALDAAKAELNSAKARYERAQTEFQRRERLFKQKAGSEAELVEWKGERDIALAEIANAEARVENAELELSYTEIRAPIRGRIGRRLVDIGNLVGAGEFTHLTSIARYDPIFAYFSLNERDLLRAQRESRKGQIEARDEQREEKPIVVELGLPDDDGFPYSGVYDFADLTVDPGTGTLLLRAVFDNPEPWALFPGLFVRLRIPLEERPNSLLVDERALGIDQRGRYLMIVNDENVVEHRPVKVGVLVKGMRVIEEGLTGDERVVVEGLQRAIPGSTVDPQVAEAKPASELQQEAKDSGSSPEPGSESQ